MSKNSRDATRREDSALLVESELAIIELSRF